MRNALAAGEAPVMGAGTGAKPGPLSWLPAFVLAEATLSYVGLGFPDAVPTWGTMLHDASNVALLGDAPWTAADVMQTVDKQLGAIARPKDVHFVTLLPKTRSGKTLRRSIQALAEGRDPGDLTTIEDPNALEQIRKALQP